MKNIFENIDRKRTILVICFTIDDTNDLYYTLLSTKKIDPSNIEKYDRNDNNGKLKRDVYDSGNVIISTNLAGRCTDIKLTKQVKDNGGLHVIVAFIPSNKRIEEQALGRSPRAGEKGSGIIIPFENTNIKRLQNIRDQRDEEKQIKNIELNAFIFEKFSKLYHKMQDKIIKMNFNDYLVREVAFRSISCDKSKEFAILDDIEEKFGIFLKEEGLENDNEILMKTKLKKNMKNLKIILKINILKNMKN